jgi:hypothetical protein
MSIARVSSRILLAFVLSTAFGCSNHPRRLRHQPQVQTNAGSALRFGDRTPGVVFVTSQGSITTHSWSDPLPMEEIPALDQRPDGIWTWAAWLSRRTVVG